MSVAFDEILYYKNYIIPKAGDRGGEKIYPAEVENALVEYPEIIDAHIVGVPEKRMDEGIVHYNFYRLSFLSSASFKNRAFNIMRASNELL